MAMTNYPYPASFLEPMPAWPINEAVKAWVDIPTKAELAKEQQSDVESDSIASKLIRATRGFFERSAKSMLAYVSPSNLTPIDIEEKHEKKLQ